MTNNDIIDAMGIQDASEEIKNRAIESVTEVVEMRVMGMVDEMMTEEQRTEFDKLPQEDAEKVYEWVSKEVTDLEKLFEATLGDYLEEIKQRESK